MRLGILISALLHAGIIAWAVVSINATKPALEPKVQPIIVDIMKVSDLTRIKAGNEKAKPKAKPKAKSEPKKKTTKPAKASPKRVAARAPKAAEPDAQPKAKPKKAEPKEKVPALKKKPEPKKAKPKPKPKPKKKVTKPKRKRTPPSKNKSKFDADNIAALLNKIPDAPAKTKKRTKAKAAPKIESDFGQFDGAGPELTMSEFDFFMRQIGQCWNPPVGATGAQSLVPIIAFRLRRNGSLNGQPRAVNGQLSAFFLAAADAAIRAIVACAPYNLPKEKYKDWASNEITFDPKAMFGG